MPLPLIPAILGVAALGTAAYGIKKGVDAYSDTKTAEYEHERAKEEYNETEGKLQSKTKEAQDQFELLGYLQAEIIKGALHRYATFIDTLHIQNNVDLQNIIGKEMLDKIAHTQESIASLETTLAGFTSGALAGAIAGFGMYGGVGLLASASTGTAIASLSGVAATNATLAWFGGGSLAAGGLGMAGGAWVLGGIVAAPVIAVAASVFAASAEKNKYDAYAYRNSISALCESMRAEGLVWEELSNKAKEKRMGLKESHTHFITLLDKIENIVSNKGVDTKKWNNDEYEELKTLMQFAEVIVAAINAPIMNDEDRLTKKLIEHQEECAKLMKEIQEKWKV